MRRRACIHGLALLGAAAVWPRTARAHDQAPRRLVIERTSPRALALTYQVEVVEALHPLLAPRTTRMQFLEVQGRLSAAAFERALQAARPMVQAQTRLIAPGGAAATLDAWEWPAAPQWQQPLQAAAFLQQAGAAPAEHLASVTLRARATVPPRAARLQLSVPAAWHPLEVSYAGTDRFWLTDALTSAMLDL